MKDLRAVLANGNLRLLVFGRLVSSGGDWLYTVALSIAVYRFSHGNAVALGALWAVRLATTLIANAPVGALVDRLGYRRSMIIADIGRGILIAILAVILNGTTWPAIFVVVFLTTVLGSLFRPASLGLIPRLVNAPSERLAANAVLMEGDSLAMVAGSAVGGVVAGLASVNDLLAIQAATFGFSALTLLLLRTAAQPTTASGAEQAEEGPSGLLAGLRVVAARPALVFAVTVMAFPEVGSGAYIVWIVPYAHALHLGSPGVGYLYAGLGIGSVVGAIAAAVIGGNIRLDILLAVSVAIGGLGLLAFGLWPLALIAIPAIAVIGLSETVEYSAYETLLQQSVPEGTIGRTAGAIEAAFYGLILVGNIGGGVLARWIGVSGAVEILAGLILAATIAGWWNFRRTTIDRPTALSLARIPVFSGLPFEEREWAVRRMVREQFEPGTVVIRQGDLGDKFYAIARGKAEVEISQNDHLETRELGSGDIFGEIALIENVPRTATIKALTPLTTYALTREDFDELQSRAAQFRESLLDVTAARREHDATIRLSPSSLA